MTVTSTTAKSGPYDGNDVTVTFDYTFYIASESELKVTLTDDDGVDTVQTLTTEYSVSIGDDGTGTFTMVTAPATGEQVTATLNVELKQETDLLNYGTFSAEIHETALDKLTRISQQISEKVDRCLKLGQSSDLDPEDVTLANLAEQVIIDTANFSNVLSAADDTLQEALETIDTFQDITTNTQTIFDGTTKLATCEYVDRQTKILLDSTTVSAQSYLDCYSTSNLYGSYDHLEIELIGIGPSATDKDIYLQLLDSAGSPYTGSNYNVVVNGLDSAGNSIQWYAEDQSTCQLGDDQGLGFPNIIDGMLLCGCTSGGYVRWQGNLVWRKATKRLISVLACGIYDDTISDLGGARLYYPGATITGTARLWALQIGS